MGTRSADEILRSQRWHTPLSLVLLIALAPCLIGTASAVAPVLEVAMAGEVSGSSCAAAQAGKKASPLPQGGGSGTGVGIFLDGFEALPCRFTPSWTSKAFFREKAWDTTLASTLGRKSAIGPSVEDPVYLDMNRDGRLNITGGQAIVFDINGDGIVDTVHEWSALDGQLVYDANGNGIIDDGRELMNETGILGEQNLYLRGWDKARALFDANHDGIIEGAELAQVLIWTDLNGDGISDACELASANELHIVRIDTMDGWFNVGALFADGFEPR